MPQQRAPSPTPPRIGVVDSTLQEREPKGNDHRFPVWAARTARWARPPTPLCSRCVIPQAPSRDTVPHSMQPDAKQRRLAHNLQTSCIARARTTNVNSFDNGIRCVACFSRKVSRMIDFAVVLTLGSWMSYHAPSEDGELGGCHGELRSAATMLHLLRARPTLSAKPKQMLPLLCPKQVASHGREATKNLPTLTNKISIMLSLLRWVSGREIESTSAHV